MNHLHWYKKLPIVLVILIGVIGCVPTPSPTVPVYPIAQSQPMYTLMTPTEARQCVEDKITSLDEDVRKFLKDFVKDLQPGDDMVSGVRINTTDCIAVAMTAQLLKITNANGQFEGMVYGLFINSTDLEVVGGGTKRVIPKGIYSWAVGPRKIGLKSMTESRNIDIEFDQPFDDLQEITAKFIPTMSVALNNFTIVINGKRIDLAYATRPVTSDTTNPIPALPPLTSSTLSPIDTSAYPFGVGDTWIYSKAVSEGYDMQFWVQLGMQDGMAANMLLKDPNCDPGTYEEEYSIVSQISDYSWEMKITAPSGKCLGRYRDASKIVWTVEPISISPEVQGRIIIEEIYYEMWPGDWPLVDRSSMTVPYVHKQPLGYLLIGAEHSIFLSDYELAVMLYGGTTNSKVDTPAGTFSNCSAMRAYVSEDFFKQGDKKSISDLTTGWQDKYVYCMGTGFVEFSQEDLQGNVMYTMQLVKYRPAFRH